jgi:hypothetical protein
MTPTEARLRLFGSGYYPQSLNGENSSVPNQANTLDREGGL